MAKVKVATDWLDICSGCHMAVLDIDERIVELVKHVQFTSSPITDLKHPPEDGVDVGILTGVGLVQVEVNHLGRVWHTKALLDRERPDRLQFASVHRRRQCQEAKSREKRGQGPQCLSPSAPNAFERQGPVATGRIGIVARCRMPCQEIRALVREADSPLPRGPRSRGTIPI